MRGIILLSPWTTFPFRGKHGSLELGPSFQAEVSYR